MWRRESLIRKVKRVLLGVSGSIAAYKTLILSRELFKRGKEIKVILTSKSLNFITPLSFQELSNSEVFTDKDFFRRNTHIELARWGEIFLVVPATYNIIGKVANGIADDLLTSTIASFKGNVIFVPAMHTEMWNNPILKDNIERLKRYGHVVFPVEVGPLASGDYGEGRMVEVEDILRFMEDIDKSSSFWKDKRVIITYGGTMEKIDDVRVITNLSSGKMGIALSSFLSSLGAHVIAIGCGNVEVAPSKEFYRVYTVEELYDRLGSLDYDYLFMCAAVSDYKPKGVRGKIKKDKDVLTLELERTMDILSEISRNKKGKIVGFALEERKNLEEEALRKLNEKNLDYIIANPLEVIGKDHTEVAVYSRQGLLGKYEGTKWEVAREIIKRLSSA